MCEKRERTNSWTSRSGCCSRPFATSAATRSASCVGVRAEEPDEPIGEPEEQQSLREQQDREQRDEPERDAPVETSIPDRVSDICELVPRAPDREDEAGSAGSSSIFRRTRLTSVSTLRSVMCVSSPHTLCISASRLKTMPLLLASRYSRSNSCAVSSISRSFKSRVPSCGIDVTTVRRARRRVPAAAREGRRRSSARTRAMNSRMPNGFVR